MVTARWKLRRGWKPSTLTTKEHSMIALLIILLLLAGCYLLALRGRTNHPGLADLQGWAYAHRGLHNETRPENSMAAFQAALDSGYGIELDIHLLKDGNLVVIHDSLLKRTTGAEGKIEDLTTEQLKQYRLEGTDQCIPTFREVLDLFDGKAPMIVELKATGNNHAALTKAACDMLDSYNGVYCLESFDPRCIHWLKKNRPELIRGQLTENSLHEKNPVPWYLRFLLTFQLENFLIGPDFVAHRYADRKFLSNTLVRKFWKVQGVAWTLRSQEDFDTAVKEGYLPIFEGFNP